MANSHRRAWFDAEVRRGTYPNASTLARRFEISRRQAARDIEYLRYSMGAPVEFSSEKNGYFYADEAYALPALMVNDRERSALAYLSDRYAALDGEAAAQVAGVLRRLSIRSTAATAEVPVLPLDTAEWDASNVVRRSIADRRKLRARYRGGDGIVGWRTLWPYGVVSRLGVLSCVAYCEETGVTSLFPVFRFERAEQTADEFEVPPYVHTGEWSGETIAPAPFVAVVRLEDPSHAERIEGAMTLDDGLVRIEFHESAALITSLLAGSRGFEVLSPGWLRRRVAERLAPLVAAHSTQVSGATPTAG